MMGRSILLWRREFRSSLHSRMTSLSALHVDYSHRTKCFIKGKGQEDVKAGWYYDITAVVTPIKYQGE